MKARRPGRDMLRVMGGSTRGAACPVLTRCAFCEPAVTSAGGTGAAAAAGGAGAEVERPEPLAPVLVPACSAWARVRLMPGRVASPHDVTMLLAALLAAAEPTAVPVPASAPRPAAAGDFPLHSVWWGA